VLDVLVYLTITGRLVVFYCVLWSVDLYVSFLNSPIYIRLVV